MKIEFYLNGNSQAFYGPPENRLLDVLRDHFGLKSLKEGCGEGECGACTVLLDGKAVASCILPVGAAAGRQIETLEGIRNSNSYNLIKQAFRESGAVQCGFCTPGMVMATEALLRENPNPDKTDIRRALSGNLCRCTGYNMILTGVEQAVKRQEEL